MNADQALAALKKAGKANTVKIYARHGVTGPCFGVSYADVRALARKIGTNHDVATALWRSGNHDARVLAAMVADPSAMDVATITKWLTESDNYLLADGVSGIAAAMPAALDLSREWITSGREWTSSAGWNVMGALASKGRLVASDVNEVVDRIERTIHAQPNRTRYAMNNALISIGGYLPALRARALEAARAIGHVDVDHGETGCKTPDAASYIEKMDAREKSRAKPKVSARRGGTR